MPWWKKLLNLASGGGALIIKMACEIIGIGSIVTPDFKGTCTLTTEYGFGWWFRSLCTSLTSIGSFVTPNPKLTCAITSTYSLAVV